LPANHSVTGAYADVNEDILFYWDCDVSGSAPYTPQIGSGTIAEGSGVTSSSDGVDGGNCIISDGGSASTPCFTVGASNIDLSGGSISLWLKPDYSGAASNSSYIIRMTPTSGDFRLYHHTDGNLYFLYGDGTATIPWSPTAGVFNCITIRYGINYASIFIDNIEGTPDTALTQPTGVQDWHLSGGVWAYKFDGIIDEVTITNNPLTPQLPFVMGAGPVHAPKREVS